MNIIDQIAITPGNVALSNEIEKSAVDLKQRLLKVDINSLDLSEYTKKYYKDYLNKIDYALQACSFIVLWSIHNSGKNQSEVCFVDNGGGVGILSLLAKASGIKTVIYHDIYDISAKDAQTIANAIGLKADCYVTGDTVDLVNYINQNNLECDIIASRNVIEHIYNLQEYFQTISKIHSKNLSLFIATTANNKNILTDLYTKRIHKKIESRGYTGKWVKGRDSRLSYQAIRKNIILELLPGANHVELTNLVANTRGLRKDDIEVRIKEYKLTGKLPQVIEHPTNTCDPLTGNWAEHLVDMHEYEHLFKRNGFSFNVIPGFYNTNYKLIFLNLITPLINKLIKIVGSKGVYLSPFVALSGRKIIS